MPNPRALLQAGLLSFGLAATLGAQAGSIRTIDCNIDAYNLTGQTANDFDILLGGVTPAEVDKVYLRPQMYFPQVEVSAQPNGTLIHYSGLEVPDGGRVHIGYEISPSGPVGTIDQYWSWNGAPLGGPDFRCDPPADHRQANVTNNSLSDAWIQRRAVVRPEAVDLQNDLVRDSAFWLGALLVDSQPVALLKNQTSQHLFGDAGHGSYTLIYDVCGDAACQDIRQTVFSSVFYTPEPAMPWLAAAAALAWLVAGNRRRPAHAAGQGRRAPRS